MGFWTLTRVNPVRRFAERIPLAALCADDARLPDRVWSIASASGVGPRGASVIRETRIG